PDRPACLAGRRRACKHVAGGQGTGAPGSRRLETPGLCLYKHGPDRLGPRPGAPGKPGRPIGRCHLVNHALARRKMVENQLRANRVTEEALVAALSELPRERFVPEALAGIAYVDEDLVVAPGRTLLEPMVLGRLIQALE